MSKWKTETLKSLTLQITDGKHGDCQNENNSGYYFISCKDIFDEKIHYTDARQITYADYLDTHKRTRLEINDILITNSGTIGRMAFISDAELCKKTTFQKSVAIVKPDPQKIYPKYLYYLLQSLVGSFVNSSNGSAQKNLLLSTMRDFSVCYINDVPVQRKIADVLSAYDDLIENNRRQIKLLEEAARRLYKEWFIDLRFPGHESTPIINGIPEGWERKKLGEWVNTFSGGTPSRKNKEFYQNGSNFWLKTQELTDSFIFETEEKITDRAIEYSSAKYIYPNSIIMAMYGATIGKLGIAATTLTCNQACCVFDLSSDSKKMPYLYLWLKSNRDFFISQGIGSAQSNLSQAMFKNFDIIVPCQKTLSNFSPITTKIFAKILKLQKSVNEAKNARDCLLPKLMTGELEVK